MKDYVNVMSNSKVTTKTKIWQTECLSVVFLMAFQNHLLGEPYNRSNLGCVFQHVTCECANMSCWRFKNTALPATETSPAFISS